MDSNKLQKSNIYPSVLVHDLQTIVLRLAKRSDRGSGVFVKPWSPESIRGFRKIGSGNARESAGWHL